MKHLSHSRVQFVRAAWVLALVPFSIGAGHALAQTPASEAKPQPGKYITQSTADHSTFEELQVDFLDGPSVTKACLGCHTEASKQMMATSHWTWLSPNKQLDASEDAHNIPLGKADNVINNFCIAIPSNEPRCTSCHAGYGWKDKNFDFSNEALVDCLVCHDQTGKYKKFPTGAGHPVYKKDFPEGREWPPKSGKIMPPVDLTNIAQNVGPPTRKNCGSCHFFGGGGEGVKHGDMDVTLVKPHAGIDVHMDIDGPDFDCMQCHTTSDHQIAGRSFEVPAYEDREFLMRGKEGNLLACESCHSASPHPVGGPALTSGGQATPLSIAEKSRNNKLNEHSDKVACQTCHIPTMAREKATKTWWDWSTAGKKTEDKKPIVTKVDLKGETVMTYHTKKGDFIWARDAEPEYIWFNGKMRFTVYGDKVDDVTPMKDHDPMTYRQTDMNRSDLHDLDADKPMTLINWCATDGYSDADARIWPAKIMRGIQGYDTVNKTLLVPKLFPGKGADKAEAYWKSYDWARAFKAGMTYTGLDYSGEYGWIQTEMIWPLKHMVAPKENAVGCDECHVPDGRLAQLTGFYMPGRDKNTLVDMLGMLIIAGGLAFALGHGLLRIVFNAKG